MFRGFTNKVKAIFPLPVTNSFSISHLIKKNECQQQLDAALT